MTIAQGNPITDLESAILKQFGGHHEFCAKIKWARNKYEYRKKKDSISLYEFIEVIKILDLTSEEKEYYLHKYYPKEYEYFQGSLESMIKRNPNLQEEIENELSSCETFMPMAELLLPIRTTIFSIKDKYGNVGENLVLRLHKKNLIETDIDGSLYLKNCEPKQSFRFSHKTTRELMQNSLNLIDNKKFGKKQQIMTYQMGGWSKEAWEDIHSKMEDLAKYIELKRKDPSSSGNIPGWSQLAMGKFEKPQEPL